MRRWSMWNAFFLFDLKKERKTVNKLERNFKNGFDESPLLLPKRLNFCWTLECCTFFFSFWVISGQLLLFVTCYYSHGVTFHWQWWQYTATIFRITIKSMNSFQEISLPFITFSPLFFGFKKFAWIPRYSCIVRWHKGFALNRSSIQVRNPKFQGHRDVFFDEKVFDRIEKRK